MNYWGDVLRDHGIGLNKSRKYYGITARMNLFLTFGEYGTEYHFLELLDDGGVLVLFRQNLYRFTKNISMIYNVNVGTSGATSAWLHRPEDAVYTISAVAGSLGKRRVNDGGTIWAKAVSVNDMYVCANSTGVYLLDPIAKTVKKHSHVDGALIWTSPLLPEKCSSIQVNDTGEVFASGNAGMYKITATGSALSTVISSRSQPFFRIFPGDSNIWMSTTNSLGRWTFSGTGPTELIASSYELGDYRNNSFNPLHIALGKTRIFVATNRGDILVFSRSGFSFIDKIACNAVRLAANPNNDNVVAWQEEINSATNNQNLMTIYSL
ncbi:hypothetical protein [uncultured Brevibacillus sp.]|uniref:hypothetical protein n=1 Tax=uncultured Brevibacillus sp. TaxID=169970 RepID=UPI0025935BC2|nr:hypothetical protein [uncultured Brevibacillus sp.]